ncbi:MAG: SGNH/GDSL hydrolase family protein [Clostridia bacterium]|nr:SGNH/GDSL hydrolase family protein [Clostridia bacterium]
MKKALAILIALAMLFTCVGCGEDPVDSSATTTTIEAVDVTTTVDANNADQTTAPSSSKQPTKGSSSTKSTGISSTSSTTSKPTRASEFHKAKYRRYGKYITVRGGMKNTAHRIVNDLQLRISFMGGSVTEGMGSSRVKGGFRTRLINFLREECPSALFTETNSTLGGNGSQYGVYVAEQMVASTTPDLVFIEYAVNNGYDGVRDADKLWNHYETMIHTIRKANPYADIVLVYVSDRSETSQNIIPILEQIADKYQLTSINLHQAMKDSMNSDYKWEYYYGDDSVHPNDNGYDVMAEVLFGAVQYGLTTTPYTYAKLPLPAAKGALQSEAKAVAATSCTIPAGWAKSGKFSYGVNLFSGCIQTTETGKTLTVKFKGTHFGVLVEFAEVAGVLEYSVDGGTYQQLNCNLNYSNPKARMLLENAANTEHTITMRLASGSRMQIAAYLMNGTLVSVG